MPAFSPRLHEALAFAAKAHRAQVRKGTDVPYITHPVEVALILLLHGFGEDLAIAGLLHDTVEDCDVTLEEIGARFGAPVASLVAGVTETKDDGGGRRAWRVRKQEQLAQLAAAGSELAALKAADALHNAACTVVALRAHGAAVWGRFNAGREDSLWYYGEVARLVTERLGDHALARELSETVAQLAATG